MKFLVSLIFGITLLFTTRQIVVAQVKLPSAMSLPTPGGGGGGSRGGKGGGALLDDSTKNVYGPSTTKHFFEKDIYNNRDSVRYIVDTSLTNFQRWTPVDQAWGTLMDLGNNVTATTNVFFQPRTDIGAQLGMRVYDAYAIKPEDVQYYDTHSQHTDITFIAGPRKTSVGRFGYTQNVHSRFNFGMQAQRFTSNKQYGSYGTINSDKFLGENWTFLAQTSFFSKNKKYVLLAHYRHLNQKVREQGGVIPDSAANGDGIYTYDGAARISDDANSWERRHGIHIYHQYRLANGFQIFQQADYSSVINRYTDLDMTLGLKNQIYPNAYFDTMAVRQDIFYKLFDNRIGIKGHFSGFNYRAFARQRFYGMNTQAQVTSEAGSPYVTYRTGLKFESILGAWIGYYFRDSSQYMTAEIEHLLGKDLKMKGELTTKWIKAGYQTMLTSPDLIMRYYSGNVFRWKNDFKSEWVNTLYGSLPFRTTKVTFVPEAQYHLIKDHMYYDSTGNPQQAEKPINLFRLGATADIRLSRWGLAGRSYYTINENKNIIRNPNFFVSAQVTFDFVYSKVLFIQLGLSGVYRSTYEAYSYQPVTQQFQLPSSIYNAQQTDGALGADLFANIRITRVRVFFKFAHVNQGNRFLQKGYYQSPGYLALQRSFGFGIVWPLFD